MTYSVVVLDKASGALAIAIQSKVLAAGAGLAWAEAGVGAIATQALINRSYGPDGLRLLRTGNSASEAVAELTAADELRRHRQIGVVTAGGDAHAYTGAECIPWAGHRLAPGISAQGNILAGPRVVDDLLEVARGPGRLAERLVDALLAAEAAGGDRRGRQAAALLVVATGSQDDPDQIDLRVDDDEDPLRRLAALLDQHRLLTDPPSFTEPQPLTPVLATELASLLRGVGVTPDRLPSVAIPELVDLELLSEVGAMPAGEPRPLPEGWDEAWQAALIAWMALENLQARLAAPGTVDRRVVQHLRARAGT